MPRRFNSKGENELRNHVKNNFPEIKWSSGGCHKIAEHIYKAHDIYSKELKLIIEYDGIYHWKNIYGNLAKVQEKDMALEAYCRQSGWKLVRINEKTFMSMKEKSLALIFEAIKKSQELPPVTKYYLVPEI